MSRGRHEIFDRIRSSKEYHLRDSPERLDRLPKWNALQKAFPIVFSAIFVGVSGFIFIAFLFMAGGVLLAGFHAAIGVVALLMSLVPLGFVVFGIVFFQKMRGRLNSMEEMPVEAIPAIVIDKRTHVWGGTGESSTNTSYYITVEDEKGERREYRVWGGELFGRVTADDPGVLFFRGDIALDFDRIRFEAPVEGGVEHPRAGRPFRAGFSWPQETIAAGAKAPAATR